MLRLRLLAAICVFSTSAMFAQINSPTFRYVAINFPGAFSTDATGINNFGEIVGFYQAGQNCLSLSPPCPTHGFKLINKTFTSINVPGALDTFVLGVNDGGDVVGFFDTGENTVQHGFLLHHTGQLQIIDPPSPLFGRPQAVNNSLVVVGGNFKWHAGKFTKMDFRASPQGPSSGEAQQLNGISNPGIIVGTLFQQDFSHGLMVAGSDVDNFPRIGTDTFINGVNGRADVVGQGGIGNGGFVAFHVEAGETSTDGSERPLNPIVVLFPGSAETFPASINYNQAIVGTYHNSDSIDHGFLAVH